MSKLDDIMSFLDDAMASIQDAQDEFEKKLKKDIEKDRIRDEADELCFKRAAEYRIMQDILNLDSIFN